MKRKWGKCIYYRSSNGFCLSLVHVEEEVVLGELQNPAAVGVSEAVKVAVVHVVGAVDGAVGRSQVVALDDVGGQGEGDGDESRARQDEEEHQDREPAEVLRPENAAIMM